MKAQGLRLAFVAVLAAFPVLAGLGGPHADEAADAAVRVSVAAPAAWVDSQDYDPEALRGQHTGGAPYLLFSTQRRLSGDNSAYYTRFVRRVDDISDAQAVSQISLSFDPSFQKLIIHHVRVRRGDQVEDRFVREQLKLLHTETEAARLLYNGEVTASFIMKDVRPGDVIDYAYTVLGRNPVFRGHADTSVGLAFTVPMGRRYVRLVVPDGQNYQTRTFAGGEAPSVRVEGADRVLEWNLHNVPGRKNDEDEPSWFESYAGYELSDFDGWPALGRHHSANFAVPETISPALERVIDRIQADHAGPAGRVRAALRFVQTTIRYLGLESGIGAFAPRDPSQVLDQRFGDCKDKTFLLVTILDRLGIEAVPALVNTRIHEHFQNALPTSGSFDHVITRVALDQGVYWLDPTKDDQIGDLDHLQQASFGAGLLLAGADSRIETMPDRPAGGIYDADAVDRFNLADTPGAVGFHATTTLWGDRADRLRRWVKSDGLAEVQKNYLNYYAKDYPTIRLLAQMSVTENQDAGIVTIEEWYEIPDAWSVDEAAAQMTFDAWPNEVRSAMPEVKGSQRTTPRAIGWPTAVRHQLVFELDSGWEFSSEETLIDNDAFRYSKQARFADDVYSETYEYRGKAEAIALEAMATVRKDMDLMWDKSSVSLYKPVPGAKASANGFDADDIPEWVGWLCLGLFLFFLLFGFVRAVTLDLTWRGDGFYFPITVSKFLVMSIVTLGLYPFFWTYKNWQWVRDVEGEKISAFWRAVFSAFTNFDLFGRIASHEKDNERWIARSAGVLAALYLIIVLVGRGLGRVEGLELYAFALAFPPIALLVPLVLEIGRLNADRPEIIARNSRYTWHSVLTILLGLSVISLAMIGIMSE